MKMISALLILAFLLASLTGCLSPVSLDAYGYVISIGIDRGETKKFYYTFALQRALSDQNTDSEGGAILLAIEADDLFEAIEELEDNIPYSLNFSRTNFIIISRGSAEAGELRELVSVSFDSLRIRTSAVIITAESEASEFIGGMYSNNEANIGKLQSALMIDREKTGMVSIMSVSRLIEACAGGRFDYCSALGSYNGEILTDTEQKKSESEGKNPLEDTETGDRVGGLKSYISGTALFSGWRMTGELSRAETMFLNMATGEFKTGVLTLEYGDEGLKVSVLLKLKKSGIEAQSDITAGVNVALEASVHMKDPSIPNVELDRWIEESLPAIIEEKLMEVFLKCRDAESDAMRFGNEFVKLFPSEKAWDEFCWKERYKDFIPEFRVSIVNADKYLSEDMQ